MDLNNLIFSDIEAKIFILLLKELDESDKEFKKYIIPFSEFNFELEYVDLAKKLLSKYIEIEEKNSFLLLNIFSDIELNKDYFRINLSQKIKPYLLELKTKYKSYELENILKLKSKYAKVLYLELRKSTFDKTQIISLSDLKNLFGLLEYSLTYAEFKRKYLKPCLKDINKLTDIDIEFDEMKTARSVSHFNFSIDVKYENNDIFENEVLDRVVVIQEEVELSPLQVEAKKFQNITNQKQIDANFEVKEVVKLFDEQRKKLQPNFVRREYKNMDAQYLLRMHLKETNRTAQMFLDAVKWLFSNNPKAEFTRGYVMNITKLIEHFNSIEHQAMFSKESVQFNEEAQTWANLYKKQGMSDEQILQELKKGGYIS